MPRAASDYLPAIKNKIEENTSGRDKAPAQVPARKQQSLWSCCVFLVWSLVAPGDRVYDEWPPHPSGVMESRVFSMQLGSLTLDDQ